MNNKEKIMSETEVLFGKNLFNDNLSDEEFEALQDRAATLIDEYGWEDVFYCWKDYLFKKCHTIDDVINFANWFWSYEGQKYQIEDPYSFLAYFYYILDFKTQEYDSSDILFTLSTAILKKAGYKYADTYNNPEYMPETDPQMIEAVERLRQHAEV